MWHASYYIIMVIKTEMKTENYFISAFNMSNSVLLNFILIKELKKNVSWTPQKY